MESNEDAEPQKENKDREFILDAEKLRCVSRLAAGAAHEINNPLGGILQAAQLLERALDINNPHMLKKIEEFGFSGESRELLERYISERNLVNFIGIILDCGRRTSDLTNKLFKFLRYRPFSTARHAINKLVEMAIFLAGIENELNKTYQFKQTQVDLQLPEGSPEISADDQHVVQILLSVIRSCAIQIQARREKDEEYEGKLSINVSVIEKDWAAVVMTDNGDPLSESQLQDLDGSFDELDRDNGILPLAVSKYLLGSMNGGQMKHRQLPEGNRFSLLFPLASN